MSKHRFPVFVETASRRVPSGIYASPGDEPAAVSLRLREKGWQPYRARLDEPAGAWIASVIDWKKSDQHAA
jgi:hypothetical protein